MKPIAKLHITRQRLYSKACEAETSEEPNCSRSEWLNWTPCSASCGKGVKIRQRAHMTEKQAAECRLSFVEHKNCFVECTTDETELNKETVDSTENVPSCDDGDENCKEVSNSYIMVHLHVVNEGQWKEFIRSIIWPYTSELV